MNRLTESETLIAKIVARLAANGVLSTQISNREFSIGDEAVTEDFFVQAVKWLEAEGIVRHDGLHSGETAGEVWVDPVLTSLGFRLLDTAFKDGLTLGIAVKHASSESKNFSNIGDLVGGILGGFTKSLGSA